MQIGLLIYLVGMAFAFIVALPASLITRWAFSKIGMLPENENDYQEKNKKDKLFWSVFLYFCVVVFLLEQYFYSKVRYGEENFIVALIFILAATVAVVFRVLMISNAEKLLPKLINAFGRFILFLWIAIIVICLVIGVGVFISLSLEIMLNALIWLLTVGLRGTIIFHPSNCLWVNHIACTFHALFKSRRLILICE